MKILIIIYFVIWLVLFIAFMINHKEINFNKQLEKKKKREMRFINKIEKVIRRG